MGKKYVMCAIPVVMITAVALFFLSKGPKGNSPDPEHLQPIKQAYLEMKKETGYPDYITASEVYIEEYCGTYNGCVAVMLSDNEAVYTQAVWDVTVAGVTIRYSNGNQIYAWKDGEMVTLEQAYAMRWLTKADIKTIRFLHYLHR